MFPRYAKHPPNSKWKSVWTAIRAKHCISKRLTTPWTDSLGGHKTTASLSVCKHERANGWRYPLVGGTRECHFAGTSLQPRKLPENAQSPTSREIGRASCR